MADDDPAGHQRELLGHEIERISELLRTADLDHAVPHLGRWKVRDVAAHLGGVHRWADRIVTERSQAGPGFKKSKLTGTELLDWFDQGAAELIATFAANDATDNCPNFNPGSPKTVGWWLRRQLHETTVHRWDIEQALGLITPIDLAAAADGVDEFLDVFVRTRGKQTLSTTLVLSTVQPERSWTLTPAAKAARIDVSAGDTADAAATVCGPADQLLLSLWGRLTVEQTDLKIAGDSTVAACMLTLS